MLLEDNRVDEARDEVDLLSPKTTQGIDARFNAIKTRSMRSMRRRTCRLPMPWKRKSPRTRTISKRASIWPARYRAPQI